MAADKHSGIHILGFADYSVELSVECTDPELTAEQVEHFG